MLKKEKISAPQKVFILYASHACSRKDFKSDLKGHTHPDCWQIEFIVDGEVDLETKERSYHLESGDSILIPAGIWHRFAFGEKSKESWSIKFSVEGFKRRCEIKVIDDSLPKTFFKEQILKLAPTFRDKTTASLIEYLLGDLLDVEYCQDDADSESALMKKIREAVLDSYGMNVKVKDVAKELGYTKEHLNKVFREQMGVSIKSYIDMERYKRAKKHLSYSDKNISEIAVMMGFPDVFAFSRFFRRMNGDSPRCFKNYVKNQNSQL